MSRFANALGLAFVLTIASCGDSRSAQSTADAMAVPDAVTMMDAPAATAADCPGGVFPPLSACIAGELFADCGGTGAPRFACVNEPTNRRCTWFTTGCVAETYVASPCPASNVCCVSGVPFADTRYLEPAIVTLYGTGREPWDRTRDVNVDVTLDPSLTPARSVTCEGVDPVDLNWNPPAPCRWGDAGVLADPFHLVFRSGTILAFGITGLRYDALGFSGWYPLVEVDTAASRARVCAYQFTDAHTTNACPTTTAVCATSGSLTLTSLDPATLHGALEVRFANGFHLTARF